MFRWCLGWGALWQPTLVLSQVSSKSCEGKRVPFSATVALGSGPDGDGLEVRDRALSCSSRDKMIPSPCSSDESRVWAEGRRKEKWSECVLHSVTLCLFKYARTSEPHWSMCENLVKQWEVTATLSEAQQQRQDVHSAGCLLGLLGARHNRITLGNTKLLSHWRGKRHTLFDETTPVNKTYFIM